MVGFGLYGSIHGPCEYQATIQIIHTGSERLLGSSEVSFTSDGSNSTFRVMFKEPIEIQPNTNYTASATLKVTFSQTLKMVKIWILNFWSNENKSSNNEKFCPKFNFSGKIAKLRIWIFVLKIIVILMHCFYCDMGIL